MKDVTIRNTDVNDAVLISVLATTTFYEAYFEQDESLNLAGYIQESFEPETLHAELADPDTTFFLIELNGKAVGYAKLVAGSLFDAIESENIIELKRFYLLERVWKSGIGRTLLEHCIEFSKNGGFDTIWLGVWEENLRAQAFYAKYEFKKVGTISFPYGDVVGTNLVLMLPLK